MPLLIGVTGMALVGLVCWGFWKYQRGSGDEILMDTHDKLLLGLLLLSAFALGVFLTQMVLRLRWLPN